MSCRHVRVHLAPVLALAGLVAGCAGDDTVPAHPTWVDDVQPILRGNCFNCHGATALKTARIMRWDVCDLTAFAAAGPFATDRIHADPNDPEVELIGARIRIPESFTAYLQPHEPNRALMPPLPADPLTEHQRSVVAAWIKDPVCGQRAHNQKPTAFWLDREHRRFAVQDGDADQVLGTMRCGSTEILIAQAGAAELPSTASPPCTLKISDGQDTVSVELAP
jgi:hypothetical protein